MTKMNHFLHTPSGRSWPTDEPHQWLLDHRDDDLLAAARERLVLSADDPERCLRAALRRCGLALISIATESQIVVRYWSGSPPDLRGWAKDSRWNRRGVRVVMVQEKNGGVVAYGDGREVLMYGEPVGPDFPWDVYEAKYAGGARPRAGRRRHSPRIPDELVLGGIDSRVVDVAGAQGDLVRGAGNVSELRPATRPCRRRVAHRHVVLPVREGCPPLPAVPAAVRDRGGEAAGVVGEGAAAGPAAHTRSALGDDSDQLVGAVAGCGATCASH